MLNPANRNENQAKVQIAQLEMKNVGQAFRLGRYPIHFHLAGEANDSYVVKSSISKTHNRAVNIHSTHGVRIEDNVVYKDKGGAFFTEDGDETNNIIKHNLIVYVLSSTSLLNEDITPACFWLTNPSNIVKGNTCAGGTHFGFWYRMHEHPTGPSFTLSICPRNVPLGEFTDNEAHTLGWFGLWIFPMYTPKVDGNCNMNAQSVTAVYNKLKAWQCEKGAEGVATSTVQMNEFVMVHNEKAGMEAKLVVASDISDVDSHKGHMFSKSVIYGYLEGLDKQPHWPESSSCTVGGIILPFSSGHLSKDICFINFFSGCAAFRFTKIDGICTHNCGGFTIYTKGLSFDEVTTRVLFTHIHEGVLIDLDGMLLGKEEYKESSLLPDTGDNAPK